MSVSFVIEEAHTYELQNKHVSSIEEKKQKKIQINGGTHRSDPGSYLQEIQWRERMDLKPRATLGPQVR